MVDLDNRLRDLVWGTAEGEGKDIYDVLRLIGDEYTITADELAQTTDQDILQCCLERLGYKVSFELTHIGEPEATKPPAKEHLTNLLVRDWTTDIDADSEQAKVFCERESRTLILEAPCGQDFRMPLDTFFSILSGLDAVEAGVNTGMPDNKRCYILVDVGPFHLTLRHFQRVREELKAKGITKTWTTDKNA